ncbi:MAG: M48 family metallopeptidase [Pseudomonadota bacterium]
MRLIALLLTLGLVAACDEAALPPSTSAPQQTAVAPRTAQPTVVRSASIAEREFASVVRVMEPVAERECARRTRGVNCDFRIVLDDRPNQPANAFQTLDENRRPVIVFNLRLLREAKNADEIAFVLGHEVAHHIEGHIDRQRANAEAGAVLLAGLATYLGSNASGVESATQLGAAVGARTYSKEFELEADALGTVIAARAGYDPVRGADFFNRIPDPGDRFLGTHPPNAERIATVRRVAAGL